MLFAEKSQRRPIDNILMVLSLIGLVQLGVTTLVTGYVITDHILHYNPDEWITIPPSVY